MEEEGARGAVMAGAGGREVAEIVGGDHRRGVTILA
jgi:hypothetical protein